MRMLIDALRSYIHRACWLADHQDHGWDRTLGVLPKAMASQAAWKIATWTLEVYGGYGYMKEFGVEKLVRDAAGFLHSDGARCFSRTQTSCSNERRARPGAASLQ